MICLVFLGGGGGGGGGDGSDNVGMVLSARVCFGV